MADVIYSPQECKSHFGLFTWIALCIAAIVWTLRLIRGVYHMFHFWDIKQFFNTALDVADSELDNLTWHEIQTRVRNVQLEQQMCIHKRELSELDIYHRILRQQNYMVAMANKCLLPPRLRLPFVGEVVYWTRSLRHNIYFLLFWGPWAPFENPWHLRENYRKPNMRHELSKQLARHVLWLALANLVFAPLVFIWQILYAFFNYAEVIKREPGSLGVRNWSLYGRLYLRHFNELDHELNARLNRAHRPATKYLSAFSSPMATVFARSFAFMCGAVLAVLLLLTVYDEDVLSVEHVLTMMTLLGASVAVCRALIPDETMAWCPETLLANVLAHTHYLPSGWKNQAHTTRVRSEFQQLFQIRVVGVLEELLSPLITPYLLWRHIYPRTLDFVDFYRNFTVSVVGVGDVCSFAQMDVRKHGNPDWQGGYTSVAAAPNQYTQAEDGKTELSLMHFKLTNPSWHPPPEAQQFVEAVERESSLIMPHSEGELYTNADLTDSSIRGDAYRLEGPLNSNIENMSLSTLYLHDRHYRQAGSRYRRPAEETTPLLRSN
ncbi:autophagy-related protein 9A isoform X2 [Agrilus planipennis]|nr:autophagy-related protein 9A isoform X2 [Agrilus planipennis]